MSGEREVTAPSPYTEPSTNSTPLPPEATFSALIEVPVLTEPQPKPPPPPSGLLDQLIAPFKERPTLLLLNKARALDGVGLLAFVSAFIGPLTLEVIFAHRELWFHDHKAWQLKAPLIVWQVWTLIGSMLLVGWGLNRAATGGVAGLPRLVGVKGLVKLPNPQQHYASVVTFIGVVVYVLFGLPSWLWMSSLGLPAFDGLLFKLFADACALLALPLLLAWMSTQTRRSWGLLVIGLTWVLICSLFIL